MTRVNLLLLFAVLASCLVLVQIAYESRRLFTALDRARQQEAQLDTEFKRLDAERQAQATNLRVEAVARDKLKMRAATPAVTLYLADGSLPDPGNPASMPVGTPVDSTTEAGR
jgi:cell division protein FtsL